ncbi:MAG: DUF4304 domain-containing protein [Gemmataceae bacterium]
MARADSPAEALLTDVIAQAVTPALKAAGLRKSGTNYHRRHGETVQVVNVQVSHGSTWSEKEFFINAGIAFDAICALAGVPELDRPKEYECDDRGTRDRLGALIPTAPESWVLRVGEDTGGVVGALRGCVELLVAELDSIDGLAAYRSHRWFDRFQPAQANAQVLYLLGDRAGSWREVQSLAAFFADRQNANRTEWWVERLRLAGLGPPNQALQQTGGTRVVSGSS